MPVRRYFVNVTHGSTDNMVSECIDSCGRSGRHGKCQCQQYSQLQPVEETTGHQGWEKEDYHPPLPRTSKGVIQSWPGHCELELRRNGCSQDLAGS